MREVEKQNRAICCLISEGPVAEHGAQDAALKGGELCVQA